MLVKIYIYSRDAFNPPNEAEDVVVPFERDLVIKYKGDLHKLMFHQQQAERILVTS